MAESPTRGPWDTGIAGWARRHHWRAAAIAAVIPAVLVGLGIAADYRPVDALWAIPTWGVFVGLFGGAISVAKRLTRTAAWRRFRRAASRHPWLDPLAAGATYGLLLVPQGLASGIGIVAATGWASVVGLIMAISVVLARRANASSEVVPRFGSMATRLVSIAPFVYVWFVALGMLRGSRLSREIRWSALWTAGFLFLFLVTLPIVWLFDRRRRGLRSTLTDAMSRSAADGPEHEGGDDREG